MPKLDMPKHIWEIHNPKIAEPYMKDLLEKLSESSSNWYGDSYGNDLMANVSLQYQENRWIHIQIPNSKNDRPDLEEFSKFYVYHSDQVSDFEFNKECESLDDAVKVATDLLKKLGGDKTVPQYCVTITRSEKGYIHFDNFADAKKFKDDGFIPDHLADDINWDGGSDEFDFENTTYWRKN